MLISVGLVTLVGCGPTTTASTAATMTTTLTPVSPPATTSAPPSAAPTTLGPYVPVEHAVGIADGSFVVTATDEPFIVRGVNYFRLVDWRDRVIDPGVYDRERVDADFANLAEHGYNTVRIFFDSCGCIGRPGGTGLREDTLDVLTEVMGLAKQHGLVLFLTSNDIPDEGGYRTIAGRDDSAFFPGYRNSDFLTAAGHEAMRTYWDDLLSGLTERHAPLEVVFGWSILNEQWLFTDQPPLSLDEGQVTTAAGTYDLSQPGAKRTMVIETVRAMVAGVADVIKRHDPHGLVTMGFFSPQFPNPTGIGGDWYVDTAPLVEDSALDFFDFHAYPGEDIGIAAIAENFGITGAKPVVMGEVGAFTSRFDDVERAGLTVQRWIADSCDAGFDGWLYWGWLRAPLADATWALTDADGYLFEALAPINQPDPCTPTLIDPSHAAGRPTRVSRALADQPGEAAVDGDPTTAWGAGGDAPQWIEIDLDGVTVGVVELLVSQWPAGRTVHEITLTTSGGTTVTETIDGSTDDGDTLVVTYDEPVEDVVKIRVRTRVSPSWVAWYEIEVLAP